MIDRFGLLPPAAERLFEAAELRVRAQQLGLTRVRAGSRTLTLDFGPQPRLDPARLIKLIQSQPKVYKLEGQARLHCHGDFEAVERRAPRAQELLATLRAA
jgi:transcription-repair coupling factor (superfamily II helicase)